MHRNHQGCLQWQGLVQPVQRDIHCMGNLSYEESVLKVF